MSETSCEISTDAKAHPYYANYQSETLPKIEALLDEWLTPLSGPQKELIEAARYSVLGCGKRIRPMLTLLVAERHQVPFEKALPVACAIELIHCYSLIHDDLPCMDNDDYRRGKPSLHKVYGEGSALLTGDFLLTFAFERLVNSSSLSAEEKVTVIQELSKSAGHEGMIGGQYIDISQQSEPHTKEMLHWIHEKKTGSLIRAAVSCGIKLTHLESEALSNQWELFGAQLGLLFQLIDDLMDSLPSNLTSQVPIGPSSYIALKGINSTWKEVNELKDSLTQQLSQLWPEDPRLVEMVYTICEQYKEPKTTEDEA